METIEESEEEDVIDGDENDDDTANFGSELERTIRSSTDACDDEYCPDLDETTAENEDDYEEA